jgi:hypothetical protein
MAENDSAQKLDKQQSAKPSQAEGEREQPGEPIDQKQFDPDMQPAKPSQAEGERKPYT